MAGLGETVDNVISGIFGVLSDSEVTERARINTQNIDTQLSQSRKTNNMIIYGTFGLLFVGALVAINKMA